MTRHILPVILAFCAPCLAQGPVILDLDLENETNYLYDVFDYSKNGTDSALTAIDGGFRIFAISLAVDDIVAINSKRAKGVFLFKGSGSRLGTNPQPGTIQVEVDQFAAHYLWIDSTAVTIPIR